MTELQAMFRTINNLGYQGYAMKVLCNSSTSPQVRNISKQAADSLKLAGEAKSDQSKQLADIELLAASIQNLKSLNTTELSDLQGKIKDNREAFDQQKLAHALSILREARDEQKQKIHAQKNSVSEMKKELRSLRELYTQMKLTRGCGLG